MTEGEIKRAELQGSKNSGCHLKSKSVQTSCRHSLVNNEFSLDPNSNSFKLKLKIEFSVSYKECSVSVDDRRGFEDEKERENKSKL